MGQAVHEVQGNVFDAVFPERLVGFSGFFGGVQAAQIFQLAVLKRLDAEAHAVYAGFLPEAHVLGAESGGVRLQGTLDIVRPADGGFYGLTDAQKGFPGEKRGRAAAEIDGGQLPVGHHGEKRFYLGDEISGVFRDLVLFRRMTEEGAVAAFSQAEGDVDVERQFFGGNGPGKGDGVFLYCFREGDVVGKESVV